MKLAIVAPGLGNDSLITINCGANSVIQAPTLLFQTDLGVYGAATPDGTTQHGSLVLVTP